jgi:UDP-N-acetylmuramoylalanine--D-glutamate ligase
LGENVETIFLGGLDRGYDFHFLVEKIKKSQIKNIVFFPESGEKIKMMLFTEQGVATSCPTYYCTLSTTSMQEAVAFAYQHTASGKICLLSTASPSYTVWKNFEEKGDLFQEWVKKLGNLSNNQTALL